MQYPHTHRHYSHTFSLWSSQALEILKFMRATHLISRIIHILIILCDKLHFLKNMWVHYPVENSTPWCAVSEIELLTYCMHTHTHTHKSTSFEYWLDKALFKVSCLYLILNYFKIVLQQVSVGRRFSKTWTAKSKAKEKNHGSDLGSRLGVYLHRIQIWQPSRLTGVSKCWAHKSLSSYAM